MVPLPKLQVTRSIHSSRSGRKPVIHNTQPSQATHDTVRSTTRTQAEAGKAAASTRAITRMTASANSAAMTIWKTGVGPLRSSHWRATSASASAAMGKNTPSCVRSPNSTRAVGKRRRKRAVSR